MSAYYSRQTDINRRYFNNQMSSLQQLNPYGYGYGYGYPYGGYGYGGYGYGGYGYGGYGYGGYNPYGYGMMQEQYQALYESAYDPDKTLDMLGLSPPMVSDSHGQMTDSKSKRVSTIQCIG